MGGARGNALLTSLVAAVLLVLLALEGATIPRIQQLLSLHVRGYRIAVTVLAIVAGVVTALATYPLADPWYHGLVR